MTTKLDNKDITLDIQKVSNRELADFIFLQLKQRCIEVYDVTYLNGYFVFEMGADSVVHFKIKGIKGWQFGIWIDKNDENSVAQIFGQVIVNIDKFKPCRSWVNFDVTKEEFSEPNVYKDGINGFIARVEFIKVHPVIAHVNDLYNEDFFAHSYLRAYINNLRWNITSKIRTSFQQWAAKLIGVLFGFFANRFKCVERTSLRDLNHDGFSVFPRYSLQIFITGENETILDRIGYFIERKFPEISILCETMNDELTSNHI